MVEKNYRKEIKKVSPSMVIKFLGDYKEWYQSYILGIKTPNNIYFELGTAVHEMKEEFFKDEPKGEEDIRAFVTRAFNEQWNVLKNKESLQEFMKDDEELNPQGFTYSTIKDWVYDSFKIWFKEVQRVEKNQFKRTGDQGLSTHLAYKWNRPVKIEEHCEMTLEDGTVVHGYIDAVYSSDNWHKASANLTFELVDYKTSSKSYKTVPTDYYLQLMIYASMYKSMKNKVNWVTVDYLKYSQKYLFKVTDKDIDVINQLLMDVKELIDIILKNPEEYEDKPPKKLSLAKYLKM